MYNLLVTSNVGAWDVSAYEFDRERFGEHTAETLVDRFKKLTASKIEELKSFPTLFAYEGQEEIVRVGYIRRIKERGKSLLVEYEFEEDIPPFNFSKIADLKVQLDIDKSEMNRTHWAIKDEGLFEVLASAGIAKQTFVNIGIVGSSLVISHLGLTSHWSGRALGIFSLRGSLYFVARR